MSTPLYFSGRFSEKLSEIHSSCLTIMEAPAGYGKTTAIQWEMNKLPDEQVNWYTAISFYQDESIEWLFYQIGRRNKEAGSALTKLGFINRSNVYNAADIINNMCIEEPTYLIIDNFQLVRDNWPPILLQALADRKQDGLHVILLSQNFGKQRVAFENSRKIAEFYPNDFLLSKEEISEYASLMGIELKDQEAELIHNNTEGWAAAISLYLREYPDLDKSPHEYKDMDELLYEFLWNKLNPEEQKLILRISVFEHIHASYLPVVAPGQEHELFNVLKRCPMIHYDRKSYSGYTHEILRNFLQDRLMETEPDFYSQVYERAADVCKIEGNIHNTVEMFYQAGKDEKLLDCDLSGLYSEDFGGFNYTELARRVLDRVSVEVLKKHPLSMLHLCLALFAGTDFDRFEKEIDRSKKIIDELNDDNLLGEWHIVAAFKEFPDIPKMKEHYIEAEKLMNRPSKIFTCKEPFMFGTTSMWYLFYRTPGKMMETGEELKDMMQVYDRITNHHGAGAYELYMSEALSVQGRFEESDLEANRAAMLSEQWQNATVTYGVALVLGINAIYQSDMAALQKAIDYLENHALAYPFLQHTAINAVMADTVRTYLLGLMMEPYRSAPWARGSADLLTDLTFTNFMAKTNRITDLILNKEYKRAIASVEASLKLDSRLISLSTRNFMCVGLALCYLAIGFISRAAEWLDQSLTLAEQDKNYTFLACFRKYLSILFMIPSIKHKHKKAIEEIKNLKIHYTKAEESKIFYMLETNPSQIDDLTEREREIAELVAEGLRNKEIAEKLFISEETVKSHIKSIFNKLNIDRRSKLVELLK